MKQQTLLALMIAGVITGCGGAGKTTSSLSTQDNTSGTGTVAAAPTTSVAQGMVTGFGSVIVNGTHYDVSAAPISFDGESAVESDLEVGQMVTITATGDADKTGHVKATKVAGETQVRGAITSLDLTAGSLVVLGQTISFTADTFFRDGVTAADLAVGVFVAISSKTNADGSITATRIDIKKPSEIKKPPMLAGLVADLNTTAMTFSLHGLSVDYSKANLTELADQTLANGLLVRAEGSLVDNIFVATSLKASVLDLKHHRDIKANMGTSIGGQVANLVANTSFSLGTTTVLFSATTNIIGGTTAELVADAKVRVMGTLDADKNLVAKVIVLIKDVKAEDHGLVQAVDVVNNTITINGIVFDLSADTSLNDRSKMDVRLFDINDIQVGDMVNIRGYNLAGKKHLTATRLERLDRDEETETSAAASSANSSEASSENSNANSSASSEDTTSSSAESSSAASSTPVAVPVALIKALNKTELTGEVDAVVDSTLSIAGHDVVVDDTTLVIGFEGKDDVLKNAKAVKVIVRGVANNDKFKAISIERFTEKKDINTQISFSSRSLSTSSWSSFSAPSFSAPAFSSVSFSSKSTRSSEAAHSEASNSSKSAHSEASSSQASSSAAASSVAN